MINSLKLKALLGFCLVHVGLALSLIAFFREDGAPLGSVTFGMLVAGAALTYGAYLFSVISVWLELRPWLERIQQARDWRTWIFREIPTFLALIPVVLSLLKILKSSWSEIKSCQDKGELNVQNLAGIAQKFAIEAETLAHAPGVELVKKRLKD